MNGAKRLRDPPDRVRTAHRLGRHARPFDEPRHEVALGLDELDHLRPDPDRGGRQRCLVLGAPVDPEQVRVATADPQHVRPVVERHLEVVVRDPAAEHLDASPARPGQTRSTISSTRIVGDPRASRELVFLQHKHLTRGLVARVEEGLCCSNTS